MERRDSGRIGAFVAVAVAAVLVSVGFLMLPTSDRAPSPLEDEHGAPADAGGRRGTQSDAAPRISPRLVLEPEDEDEVEVEGEGDEAEGDQAVEENEPAETPVAAQAPREETKTVRFSVHGAGGEPVEGAFARYLAPTELSKRTDADGMGTITLPLIADRFFVGALRYDAAQVMLPATLEAVIPVVLRPNGGIEIRLVGPSKEAANRLLARLTAETQEIFTAEPPHLACHPTMCAAGAASFGNGMARGSGRLQQLRPALELAGPDRRAQGRPSVRSGGRRSARSRPGEPRRGPRRGGVEVCRSHRDAGRPHPRRERA